MPIDPHALVDLMAPLQEDLTKSLDLLASTAWSPFARRVYVRSFLAEVEGTLHAMRDIILNETVLHVRPLAPAEAALLREESYDLDHAGSISVRTGRYQSLERRVRFVFWLHADIFGSSYRLDVSGAGWKTFREAILVRNRLMHPKSAADLNLSMAELETVKDAQLWFHGVSNAVNDSVWAALGGAPELGA